MRVSEIQAINAKTEKYAQNMHFTGGTVIA